MLPLLSIFHQDRGYKMIATLTVFDPDNQEYYEQSFNSQSELWEEVNRLDENDNTYEIDWTIDGKAYNSDFLDFEEDYGDYNHTDLEDEEI